MVDLSRLKIESELEHIAKTREALTYFYDLNMPIDRIIEECTFHFPTSQQEKLDEDAVLVMFRNSYFPKFVRQLLDYTYLKSLENNELAAHIADLGLSVFKYNLSKGNRNFFEYLAKWKKSLSR